MPYNRVNELQTLNILLALFHNGDTTRSIKYCPGVLLVPIPEAGYFFGYVDMAFWAVFVYVLGSIVYLIDSVLLWKDINSNYSDDALNPAISLNTVAAALFVINALICFFDWWLQVKQLSSYDTYDYVHNGSAVPLSPADQNNSTKYYFLNNLFFLAAAVVFLIQSIWYEDSRSDLFKCTETMYDCSLDDHDLDA
jgi:hypothetical protein